jgi:cytochrome P450
MWRLADRQLDEILPGGRFELIGGFAKPYTLLVVADLLGVPESDHEMLLEKMGFNRRTGQRDRVVGVGLVGHARHNGGTQQAGYNSLESMYDYFVGAIEQRRSRPRDDVLTGMANARFSDGSTPDPIDAARIASNLFAAGQETTVRLLGAALQRIAEQPALQQLLRDNRELIPNFVEETLRTDDPAKGSFRMARKSTRIADVDIPAGTIVMVLRGAASRDPRRFDCPAEFQVERPNARQHLGFGHGIHTCPGAPLARSEARVSIERLFDRTEGITISEEMHGPRGTRRYEYLPSYMHRGLVRLHLDVTPVS